ncbi:hypothetical protein CGLO_00565 [Colletotrichum gloeosporioides Cg-14]|uniref:Uncharacterized protein n=1 Tax=Colletotrichum gloeosporioides (strain Cg-14) TaxID=1237896 RepID=T0L2W9_COLGC|nr:hypothetical protein CGLO_00565 [Colletotrichum gloeosporioides Cg-14]
MNANIKLTISEGRAAQARNLEQLHSNQLPHFRRGRHSSLNDHQTSAEFQGRAPQLRSRHDRHLFGHLENHHGLSLSLLTQKLTHLARSHEVLPSQLAQTLVLGPPDSGFDSGSAVATGQRHSGRRLDDRHHPDLDPLFLVRTCLSFLPCLTNSLESASASESALLRPQT